MPTLSTEQHRTLRAVLEGGALIAISLAVIAFLLIGMPEHIRHRDETAEQHLELLLAGQRMTTACGVQR